MGGGKSGGATQTYDYYGSIAGGVCIGPNEELVSIILNSQEVWPQGIAWSVGLMITPGTLYVYDAQTWQCAEAHLSTTKNGPGSGLNGWTEYTFARGAEEYDDFSITASDGTYYGVLRFYWGSSTQTLDSLLTAAGNDGGVGNSTGTGDQHPDYAGLVYVELRDFLLGQEIQSGPNVEIVTRRKPNQAIIAGAATGLADGQANPAVVAAEILTDVNCLGEDAGIVDAPSFQAVADYLQGNPGLYGASVLLDSLTSITEFFDALTQMFDGFIRFNPTTKKIELGVYKHGIIPANYTTLTADSFTKFPKFNVKSWDNSFSRVNVRFNPRQINYQQTSIQVPDPRAQFVLGVSREENLDRPWITRAAQAFGHGRERLRVIGHAVMTGELEVRREIGRNIRAGDYVLVDVDLEPGAAPIYQFFRVTQRKIPPTGPITFSSFADYAIYGAPPPLPSMTPVLLKTPTIEAIANLRFVNVPSALTIDGKTQEVIILAQRNNSLLSGAFLYFDTDPAGTFPLLGTMTSFGARAQLLSDVLAGDGVIHLQVDPNQVDADLFTQQYTAIDAANDTMLAFLVSIVQPGDSSDTGVGQIAENPDGAGAQIVEICSVSIQALVAAGQYDLTVLRGRRGTGTQPFAAASTEVWLMPRALLSFFMTATFSTLIANRGTETDPWEAQFRLCPFTFEQALPLASTPTVAFRFPTTSPG